jgi:hypothetical protein
MWGSFGSRKYKIVNRKQGAKSWSRTSTQLDILEPRCFRFKKEGEKALSFLEICSRNKNGKGGRSTGPGILGTPGVKSLPTKRVGNQSQPLSVPLTQFIFVFFCKRKVDAKTATSLCVSNSCSGRNRESEARNPTGYNAL